MHNKALQDTQTLLGLLQSKTWTTTFHFLFPNAASLPLVFIALIFHARQIM